MNMNIFYYDMIQNLIYQVQGFIFLIFEYFSAFLISPISKMYRQHFILYCQRFDVSLQSVYNGPIV